MNYLKCYERYLKRRFYSAETIQHYLSDLQVFKRFTGKQWRHIKREDVADFVEDEIDQGHHPRSINRRLCVLQGYYSYLQEELEYNVENPVRSSHFVRVGRPLPMTLENQELKQLLAVIKDPRDRAIFTLMLHCGLRVSEVANLEASQINLFRRELRIMGKRKKERIVPLPKEVVNLLIQCMKKRPDHNKKFFWNKKQPTQPIKVNSIQRLIKRYGEKAGVDLHCHLLRHTFARQMTEKGVERTVLRDLMGHASISTTDVYGKLSDPFVKENYFAAIEKVMAEQEES